MVKRPWERAERDEIANKAGVKKLKEAMKEKLRASRLKGRCGWQDKNDCSQEHLSRLLREHVEKGDPVDVANFCMMLHYRGERIMGPGPNLADATKTPLPERQAGGVEARVKALEDRYEDWKRVSEPPHATQIERGCLLNFYRDADEGPGWNGTWEERRDADIWCPLVTASLNDRACALLASSSSREGAEP